jgi:hypothetical protein
VSTVRLFFFRKNASKHKEINLKPSIFEDNNLTTGEQTDNKENFEDEMFQQPVTIEVVLQFADIRSTVNTKNMAENNLTTPTSKRAVSSLKNENLLHTRKSSRFPRKKE